MLRGDSIDWQNLGAETFYSMLRSEEDALLLADSLGMLPHEVQSECGRMMTRQVCNKEKVGYVLACTNQRRVCRKTKSALEGTWFSQCRISMRQCFHAILAYAASMDCSQQTFFTGMKSTKTIVDWRANFRCVCESVIEDNGHRLIGGPGLTVEIDESMLFIRKSHVGRLLSCEQ